MSPRASAGASAEWTSASDINVDIKELERDPRLARAAPAGLSGESCVVFIFQVSRPAAGS